LVRDEKRNERRTDEKEREEEIGTPQENKKKRGEKEEELCIENDNALQVHKSLTC